MTSISIKSSTVAGKAPLPADLERAELAVNLADKQLYTKDANDEIVPLGRVDYYVGENEPAIKQFGSVWVNTAGGLRQTLVWNGAEWQDENEALIPANGILARFRVYVPSAATPFVLTCTPTGETVADCIVMWGDGSKDTSAHSGSHTYSHDGFYDIAVLLSPATAILDGNGWPTITGGEWVEFGPFTKGTTLNKMGPDTGPGVGVAPRLTGMDFSGCSFQQTQIWMSCFHQRIGHCCILIG